MGHAQFLVQATLRLEGPRIDSLQFSPDSGLLATCGREKFLNVWSTRTGPLAAQLELPTEAISALSFSHEGKALAAGDIDGRLAVWRR